MAAGNLKTPKRAVMWIQFQYSAEAYRRAE